MCVYGVSLSIFRKADYFCLYVKLNNSEIEKTFMFICASFLFIKKRKKKKKGVLNYAKERSTHGFDRRAR